MTTKTFFQSSLSVLALGALMALPSSCSDDNKKSPTLPTSEVKFALTVGDADKDLSGGAYIKVLSNLDDASRRDLVIYGDESADVAHSFDGYTRTDFNFNTNVLAAHIYAKGASEKGLGKRANGFRLYKFDGTKMTDLAAIKVDKAGGVGKFGNYVFSAEGSVPAIVRADASGASEKVTLDFSNYLINGANPSIFGITDLGNNRVALALDYADRDSFAVGFADYTLKTVKVIWSTKAGHSAAARKAQRYNQLVADASGNLYAFGGTAKSDAKVGAARIPAGKQEFDDYFFDLLKASDGYRVRKVYHVTDDKFLLEFYEDKGAPQNVDNAGRMAIADMSEKKLTWVTGLPASLVGLHVGFGEAYGGKFYLPIGAGSGLLKEKVTNVTPTVYAIDANTAVATPFLTLKAGQVVKAFNIVKK